MNCISQNNSVAVYKTTPPFIPTSCQTNTYNKENKVEKYEISTCPHCKSTSIIRNGHKNSKQQYKCKDCRKNFYETTGKPTHWLHLTDKIPLYIESLKKGMTIRKAAIYAGISKDTSFSWRHKFISSIKNTPLLAESNNVKAITLINTPYSNKGRKKAPEKIRKDSKTLIILENNQISIEKLENKSLQNQIIKNIERINVINPLKIKGLTTTIKKIDKNQILHQYKLKNQLKLTISNEIEQLSRWMSRFRGVATKYLQQYWNWYAGLFNVRIINNNDYFEKLCIENRTLDKYRRLRIH